MASGWGYRIILYTRLKKFHYGMDFPNPTGTPIYATGNGKDKEKLNILEEVMENTL